MGTEINRDFGNDADMSVHDKEHPTLGPTEGSQDVESLPRHIVPMAAFNDPNNPVAVSGSVNLSLDDHPVTHDPDYGKELHEVYGHDHVEHTMTDGARTLKQFDRSQDDEDGASWGTDTDRGEWLKADWQAQAKEYGLSTSGNLATLRERVEAHEEYDGLSDEDKLARDAEDAKNLRAGDWQDQIAAANDVDSLAQLRQLYDASGADFATVGKAFDDRQAELTSDES